MAFLVAQLIDFGYGRDQGIFAVVGRAIRDGGVPYRDAWDFKPPGIYFIYALAGDAAWGIRAIEAGALLAMACAFARLSWRYLGDSRPGILGAAFAVLTHVQLEFWHTAQPESFGAVLVAWGVVLAAEAMADDASSRRRWWAVASSGACYGAAAVLKPTIGAAGIASLGALLLVRRGEPPFRFSSMFGVLSAFIVGAVVPVGACLAFFMLRGGLPDLTNALFGFAPQYASLAWQKADAGFLLLRLLRSSLVDYSLINVVGLALLVAPPPSGRPREGLIHIGAVLAVLLAGTYAQGRLFAYHFGAAFPLMGLLAGWGFWRLWLHSRARWTGVLVFAVLVAALMSWRSATTELPDTFAQRCWMRMTAWLRPDDRQMIRDHLYSLADYRARENRWAAEWIARETAAQSSVFVYGFTPEIYLAADRHAASRYIYNVPQRALWSRAEARAELIADLRRARPEVVLVEHHDLLPWVTGTGGDSAADLGEFAALRSLLASDYVPAVRFGEFDVFRRAH
jgi:hypothetical protein